MTPAPSPRIVVVGSSCAGKSTFAARLAAARGCAFVDLDDLHWGPGWEPKPPAEFRRLVALAAAGDRWIAAGNYSLVRPLLWSRATTIVWLDLGLPRVFWRALRRTVHRCATRETLFQGNRESWRRSFFSRESILWWVLTTWRRRSKEFEAAIRSDEHAHLEWHRVRDPRAAAALLDALRAEVRPVARS